MSDDATMDDYGFDLVKDILLKEITLTEGGRVMITFEEDAGGFLNSGAKRPMWNYISPTSEHKIPATPEVILLFRRTLAAIEESDQLRAHLERTQGVSPDQDWKTGWGETPEPKSSGGTR